MVPKKNPPTIPIVAPSKVMTDTYQLWSRTTFGVIAGFVVTGLVVSYITWQARFLITGPGLILTEDTPLISNERFVTISGQATNITRITLNGRQIFTDQYGYFTEALMLENGYTIATVAATDRFGRTTEIIREFVYFPASIATSTFEAIIN